MVLQHFASRHVVSRPIASCHVMSCHVVLRDHYNSLLPDGGNAAVVLEDPVVVMQEEVDQDVGAATRATRVRQQHAHPAALIHLISEEDNKNNDDDDNNNINALGTFSVEGIFPLELTWVQTPFPQKLLRMRV